MSNYSKKQEAFGTYLLNLFGIDNSQFISSFLHYYALAYGEYVQYPSGTYFSAAGSINELLLEKDIRKNRYNIPKKIIEKKYLAATDLANYTFCAASFAIASSFVIEHRTGEKERNTGIALHNQLNLIKRAEEFQRTKGSESGIYSNPDIIKILNSKAVYYGHSEETTFPFLNEQNQVSCSPDYIFLDSEGNHFVVEEKYHYYRDPSKPTFEEKWLEWNDYYNEDIEREAEERVVKWKNFKPSFYKNHQIQLITYLKNIEQYQLKYGYLVYWYYDYKDNGEPYIHKVALKKMVLDKYTEEFYSTAFSSVKRLVEEKLQDFVIENVNPVKCAGCVVNKYCGHKSKKYTKLSLPYSKEYLRLFSVDFPEALKKDPVTPKNISSSEAESSTLTIDQIKAQLAIPVLTLVRQLDSDGNKTPWVSYWDNERRIRVTMHESIMERIKRDRSISTLKLEKTVIPSTEERQEYVRYVVMDSALE